jgi:hypothetical protein
MFSSGQHILARLQSGNLRQETWGKNRLITTIFVSLNEMVSKLLARCQAMPESTIKTPDHPLQARKRMLSYSISAPQSYRPEHISSKNSSYLILPLLLLLLPISTFQQKRNAHPWHIHRTFRTCVDEQIVQEATERGTEERRHHGYPEIIFPCRPDSMTIS